MRILYLSQLVPYPLDAGPKVRSYYVLRHLARAGHDVTLLAFSREGDTPESIHHLRQYCAAIHTIPMPRSRLRDAWHLGRSLLLDQPFLIARDTIAAMHRKARQLVSTERFDAIHADQLWMAQYALAAKSASGRWQVAGSERHSPLMTLDQHNATYLIPQRLAESETSPLQKLLLQREAKIMRRYELDVCRQFDHVIWVTAEDRAAVIDNSQFPVIPICIDPKTKPPVERVPNPHRITFLGGLHWPPNAAGIRWFTREVWPSVVEQFPTAVLTIIGNNPPPEIANLKSQVSNLQITGYVDDPTPYLQETAVFIVPLHAGGGMRVKILDAWAWGVPIVSTTIGAEGIAYHNGENLLIADDIAQFAEAIIYLMRDPDRASCLSRKGRCTLENCYDWQNEYQAWEAVYRVGSECHMDSPGTRESKPVR
jgi:glycosyltransferase involved in cell wall biosynthesis